MRRATSSDEGAYRLTDIPPGTYTVRFPGRRFLPSEIRDVHVRTPWVSVLPALRLDVPLIGDCDPNRRPEFYRMLAGSRETGGVAGIVADGKGVAIAEATVTLYRRGKGKIASQVTKGDGAFSFTGIEVSGDEYWVAIACDGYFVEEVPKVRVWAGLQALYAPVKLEACRAGSCDPGLKTIRVIRGCG